MSRKPSEIIKDQYDENFRRGQTIGFGSPDGKLLTTRLLFILASGVLGQVMHFHGLYQSWPSVPHICSSLVISCLIILLLVRLGSVFLRNDAEKIVALFEQLYTIYQREEKIERFRLILDRDVEISSFIFNTYLILNFMLFIILNPIAWIVSWYSDDLMLFAPIYLPFTDPQTLTGFLINSTLLVYYTLLLFLCFVASDLAYIGYVIRCAAMIDIYCIKWQIFGENLLKVKNEKKFAVRPSTTGSEKNLQSSAYRKVLEQEKALKIEKFEQQMIDLIKELNSYNEYVNMTIEYMEMNTFAAMILISMAIAMSFVIIFHYSKALGVSMVVFLTFQVLIPCVLGTLISNQKEKLLNELYGFQWYELSLSKQKTFLQFLHLVQNSREFKLPVIGCINMELFTIIMRAAYSYFMFLIKFIEL